MDSALAQSHPPLEVIVCCDSRPAPVFEDSRVRVILTGPRAGGNVARLAGMAAARGSLIALLDDDDVWEIDHLERVLRERDMLQDPGGDWVGSGVGLLTDGTAFPVRTIQPNEDLLDYLFSLRGGLTKKGALSTSTLVFPKSLATRVPWRSDARFHQDISWFVDLYRSTPTLQIAQAESPTVRFGDTPGSVSKSIPLDGSIAWARENLLALQTRSGRRAFADFLLSRYPMRSAITRGSWVDAARVARLALVEGRPTVWALAYAASFAAREAARELRPSRRRRS